MGIFVPKKRDTLVIPETGPLHDPNRPHLFIVLTNQCKDGKHLLVPVCSRHPKCDRSCLLDKDDHRSYLKHDSFVSYFHADLYSHSVLSKKVTSNQVVYRGAFHERTFGFVCNGLLESRLTPPAMKAYYERNASN